MATTVSFGVVRTSAMHLPETQRAELACELIASLDGAAEPDAKELWDAEVLRRLNEIEGGSAALLSRGEFSDRVASRLRRRLDP